MMQFTFDENCTWNTAANELPESAFPRIDRYDWLNPTCTHDMGNGDEPAAERSPYAVKIADSGIYGKLFIGRASQALPSPLHTPLISNDAECY